MEENFGASQKRIKKKPTATQKLGSTRQLLDRPKHLVRGKYVSFKDVCQFVQFSDLFSDSSIQFEVSVLDKMNVTESNGTDLKEMLVNLDNVD